MIINSSIPPASSVIPFVCPHFNEYCYCCGVSWSKVVLYPITNCMALKMDKEFQEYAGPTGSHSDLTGPSSICGNCKITLTVNTNAQLDSWKKQFAKRRIEHYCIVRRWPKPDHTEEKCWYCDNYKLKMRKGKKKNRKGAGRPPGFSFITPFRPAKIRQELTQGLIAQAEDAGQIDQLVRAGLSAIRKSRGLPKDAPFELLGHHGRATTFQRANPSQKRTKLVVPTSFIRQLQLVTTTSNSSMDCLMTIMNRFIGSAVRLPKRLTIVSERAEYMTHFAIKNFGEADDLLHEATDTLAKFWMAETGEVHRQSRNSTYGIVRDICGELVSQEYKSGDCLKMSIDGGGGSVKVIINHQGEAISFKGKGERQIPFVIAISEASESRALLSCMMYDLSPMFDDYNVTVACDFKCAQLLTGCTTTACVFCCTTGKRVNKSQIYSPDNRNVPRTADQAALLLKTKPARARHIDGQIHHPILDLGNDPVEIFHIPVLHISMCILRQLFQRETRLGSTCKDVWESRKLKLLVFLETNYQVKALTATCTSTLKAEHMKCPSFAGKAVSSASGAVSLWIDSGFSDCSVFVLRAWHSLRTAAWAGEEIGEVARLLYEFRIVWLDNGLTVTLLIHCLLAHFMDWYSIHRGKVQLLTEEQIESCHNDFSAVQTTHHSTAVDALGRYNFTRKDGHKRKADAPARPIRESAKRAIRFWKEIDGTDED